MLEKLFVIFVCELCRDDVGKAMQEGQKSEHPSVRKIKVMQFKIFTVIWRLFT